MAAVTPKSWTTLPRVSEPVGEFREREVEFISTAPSLLEGAGFPVRRPWPSQAIGFRQADPFLLLDHLGAIDYRPGEAKGAPWHPHRGFETVTYIIDGEMAHHDSQGGGGLIANGSTQWMTAGSGILHDEMPPDEFVAKGGLFHGIQLWVNLPQRLKWTPPRYQSLEAPTIPILVSEAGDTLIRLIAGSLGEHQGAGATWTPITFIHASLEPGARLRLPWPEEFNALAYVLSGSGTMGAAGVLVHEGQGVSFGPGTVLTATATPGLQEPTGRLELLLLGGQPIREPIASYGPFVMNTHADIVQAFDDYQSGRMGSIPATEYTQSSTPDP